MIRLLLFIPLAVMGAYFIHAGFKYTRMISSIFLSLVYAPASEPARSSTGEKMTILDSADHEIDAVLVDRKGLKNAVIFCHESGSSKESWEKYAYFLPRLGWRVLSLDFEPPAPDATNSLAQWPCDKDVERLLTVIRWAKKAFEPQARIVLFGVSKGANIAFSASFEDPSVTGVIADGLFSMKEVFRDYIRRWAPVLVKPNFFGEKYPSLIVNIFTNLGFWRCQKESGLRFLDVERHLGKKHVPLLMIHGEKDDYIPLSHQKLLERISEKKYPFQRLVVPKAGHNEAVILSRDMYETEIRLFLEKAME